MSEEPRDNIISLENFNAPELIRSPVTVSQKALLNAIGMASPDGSARSAGAQGINLAGPRWTDSMGLARIAFFLRRRQAL